MNYDIVFQEIPGEVTLAINLSNCPNRCKGCHSPYLMKDIGEPLTVEALDGLLDKYGSAITCICFMGGDMAPLEVERLSVYISRQTGGRIKTGWYSGKKELPACCCSDHFNYIKLGPYIEALGGLNCPTTNQRFYRVENSRMVDVTGAFWGENL